MDAVVLILVSGVTVMFDLAIAVIAGVIVSALVFAWENAKRIRARKRIKEDGTKVYEIWGPLFFGSVQDFMGKFDIANDPEHVEIDFIESKVSDHSGMEAIKNLVDKYEKINKKVTLKHLSPDCDELLVKANPHFKDIIIKDIEDPRQPAKQYHLRIATEERYRQVKCFSDLTKFTSRAFSMVVNQVIFMMLAYNLLQLHLFRQKRKELNQKILPHIRQQLLPWDNHIIVYYQN